MTVATDIQQLYVAFFNRPADVAGLQYWTYQVNQNGGSVASVANAFSASAEYKAIYAGKSSYDIINTIYQNLFNRPAEPAGLTFWGNALASGVINVGNVAQAIAAGAQNADLTAVQNKVSVSVQFTTNLDTNAEILGYSGDAANAVAKAFLLTVTSTNLSASLAAVDATIANVVTAHDNAVTGQTFTLTTGVDGVTGTTGNDVFNASVTGTFNPLDSIDGGAGNDTLNVTDNTAAVLTAGRTVTNVETVNLSSAFAVTADTTGYTGLTKLNVVGDAGNSSVTAAATTAVTVAAHSGGSLTVSGGASQTVTTSATAANTVTLSGSKGAVSLTGTVAGTGALTGGAISVTGGTTVTVNETQKQATLNTTTTAGTVSVTGTTDTTSVSVTNTKAVLASATVAGIANNSVTVTDVNAASATKAGTITSVAASGYTTLNISDNALTTLSLANGSGNIIIDNSGLTTATNKTLGLTVDGLTAGTLDDADIYTTLNVTTAGTKSTLSNITFGGVTALTVAGTTGLTLTSTAGLSALKTITVTGAAGITADIGTTGVTAVDTSGTTGTSAITLDATKATYTGGAGVDNVTIGTAVPTKAISGGGGTDTLSMSAANAATASGSTTFAGLVTGFEHLTLLAPTTNSVDVAALGNYNYVTSAGATALTLTGLTTGATLELTATGTAYDVSLSGAAVVSTTDVLNIVTSNGTGTAINFATTGVTVANTETVNITTADTQTTQTNVQDLIGLVDAGNKVKTVMVSGTDGLNLTFTGTGATLVDASGLTKGDFAFTSGSLTSAATIKGGLVGTNTVDFSSATKAVTYTGGTGVDTINFAAPNAQANVVTLGDGANVFNGGTNATGNNTITTGVGIDTIAVGNGNNTISTGAGADLITVGSGANTVTLGAGADTLTLSATNTSSAIFTTITDIAAGDIISNGALTAIANATGKLGAALVSGVNDYQTFLNAAAGKGAGIVSWFQFGGDTYVVEDVNASGSFTAGSDIIVKLTGTVDLSNSTLVNGGHALTIV